MKVTKVEEREPYRFRDLKFGDVFFARYKQYKNTADEQEWEGYFICIESGYEANQDNAFDLINGELRHFDNQHAVSLVTCELLIKKSEEFK